MTLIDYIPILDKITPSKKEFALVKKLSDRILSIIDSSAKKHKIEVDLVLGGSTAKGRSRDDRG